MYAAPAAPTARRGLVPCITIIGATTEPDKLLTPVLDRFKIKPYFQAYSWSELSEIAVQFAFRHAADEIVDNEMAVTMAGACRGTPRVLDEMVLAARAMTNAAGRIPAPLELLNFLEVEEDGLTRTHIHYITAMRQYFARTTKDDTIEFIVGEAAIMQILRETKPGIQRVEAFLVERGLINRTPRGRQLTALGITRAEAFIGEGKGAANQAAACAARAARHASPSSPPTSPPTASKARRPSGSASRNRRSWVGTSAV